MDFHFEYDFLGGLVVDGHFQGVDAIHGLG